MASFLFSIAQRRKHGKLTKSLQYQVAEFLSGQNLVESKEISEEFARFFNFQKRSFVDALRLYFQSIIVDNDVEKINSLLVFFAMKFFGD